MAEDNNRAMLLRRVQMYDFALQEARLFLDTSGRWEWVDNPWPWEKEAQ